MGERWQKLDPNKKESFESEAAASKKIYNAEMAGYKQTQNYRDYMHYLTNFKARHDAPSSTAGEPLNPLRGCLKPKARNP